MSPTPGVPSSRLRSLNDRPLNPNGDFVLYWMTTARRTTANFGLQRAVERCVEFGKPLVVLEALRTDYPEASDRLHQFILEGMADTKAALARGPAFYYRYVEPSRGHGSGLLEALSRHACAIVTDWYPAGFVPHMLKAGAAQVDRAPRSRRLERHHSAGGARKGLHRGPFVPRLHAAHAARSSGRLPRRASTEAAAGDSPPRKAARQHHETLARRHRRHPHRRSQSAGRAPDQSRRRRPSR